MKRKNKIYKLSHPNRKNNKITTINQIKTLSLHLKNKQLNHKNHLIQTLQNMPNNRWPQVLIIIHQPIQIKVKKDNPNFHVA